MRLILIFEKFDLPMTSEPNNIKETYPIIADTVKSAYDEIKKEKLLFMRTKQYQENMKDYRNYGHVNQCQNFRRILDIDFDMNDIMFYDEPFSRISIKIMTLDEYFSVVE